MFVFVRFRLECVESVVGAEIAEGIFVLVEIALVHVFFYVVDDAGGVGSGVRVDRTV